MPGRAPNQRATGWTIAGAEALLASLAGVVSARVVAKPGGEVEEIHLLTTADVTPKQTVRNVESALRARFDLSVDHRKISVAQTTEVPKRGSGSPPSPGLPFTPETVRPRTVEAAAQHEPRILFMGFHVESERAHQVRFQVELEWRGRRFRGTATAADVARIRAEAVANACLRAVEATAGADTGEGEVPDFALALDGVRTLDAFDRRYVLVAVHAVRGRHMVVLSGTAVMEDLPDKAVILATLQAVDRWVRGHALT